MNFTFPDIGNVIIPTDELIFFRGVGIPPTRIIQHLETLSCDSCGFARLTLGQVFGNPFTNQYAWFRDNMRYASQTLGRMSATSV